MSTQQAQIIISSPEQAKTYIKSLMDNLFIKPYNVLSFSSRLKISEARQIKTFFSKALTESERRMVIVVGNATIDAQNALLKTIEELPNYSYIVWNVMSESDVLPTILSRCVIVKLQEEGQGKEDKEIKDLVREYCSSFSQVTLYKLGEHIENINDLENVIKLLEIQLRSSLTDEIVTKEVMRILENLLEIVPLVSLNNVNPRIAFEAALLH